MAERPSALPGAGRGTVITVGTFDGLHRGHMLVLERTCEAARRSETASVVLTFDPHPLDVVNPSATPPLLTLQDEKLELLAQTGIDYVVVVPFTSDLARLSPEAFVERVLISRYDMRMLFIGHDHGFGHGRAGDEEFLRMLGSRRGFAVEAVDAVRGSDGLPVSSTTIRRALAHGDLARAQDGLGRRYAVTGHVGSGGRRGRDLGYPTLNIQVASSRKLLPPHGVYAVLVSSVRGIFGGMMNLGSRPTFGDARVALEVHAFDAAGDWYGAYVKVEFVTRLRDIIAFPSGDALAAQLRRDEADARSALTDLLRSAKVSTSGTNTSSVS